ncbi:synaptonemal complex assembly [Desmophyllum pertusum]|uniref:Synaptonemal complex assembly n=1 Tax=Desmophyllum pertusum TaxID=174260 RepID=A0A9W9YDA7_9CNID|nr:synaptonemal complex assembly [Desmophyllum pertusum]
MEKEKASTISKVPEETKELNTKEDVVSRGDTLKPGEPNERAKEPDKGNGGLSASRQEVITNENASHDDIQRSCQQLIDDINAKRKRDTDLLNDFKKALEEQINTSCSVLEESIVQTYEKHSKTIQDKLQELFAVLERISKLESELMDFRRALGVLYNDMQVV